MTVAELNAELERILNRLKNEPRVRKVLLFGALARGDARDHSDIDLIVVKDTPMIFLDRLDEFYDDAREAHGYPGLHAPRVRGDEGEAFRQEGPLRRKDAL
jgi:hypothetical protein